MFGGGKNRLLPPIKNPLFNPNGGAEEVRIAAVVRSRSKKTKYIIHTGFVPNGLPKFISL